MKIVRAVGAAMTAVAAIAPAAWARTVDVKATGNPFLGGLGYEPERVMAAVGDTVRWTNTDFLVPHTATERYGMWDLAGDYGGTPVNPPGFGPGESVSRTFEAGSQAYYCRVHGFSSQHGIVDVPVTLALTKRRVRVRGSRNRRVVQYIRATWAVAPPARGLAFDVEVQRDGRGWRSARNATTETHALIRAGRRGRVTHVRARLRKADMATGWSPDASLTAR